MIIFCNNSVLIMIVNLRYIVYMVQYSYGKYNCLIFNKNVFLGDML